MWSQIETHYLEDKITNTDVENTCCCVIHVACVRLQVPLKTLWWDKKILSLNYSVSLAREGGMKSSSENDWHYSQNINLFNFQLVVQVQRQINQQKCHQRGNERQLQERKPSWRNKRMNAWQGDSKDHFHLKKKGSHNNHGINWRLIIKPW